MRTTGFVLFICFFLGVLPLQAGINEDIIFNSEEAQTAKLIEQGVFRDDIEILKQQLQVTQSVYDSGYERYKLLYALAVGHSDLYYFLLEERVSLHPFYSGFYDAFDNYSNAAVAEPVDRAAMAAEYKKMFVEINGPFVEIPDVTAENIYDDYRSIEVNEWNRLLAGKIAGRMLNATTSMKGRIGGFRSSGRRTDYIISSTNAGIDSAIQAALGKGVTFNATDITALKESGTGTTTKYDETLGAADLVVTYLDYFENSLNTMISQEKKLEWIEIDRETALEKTGDLQILLFNLDLGTSTAADDVLNKLQPVKDKLTAIKGDIETKTDGMRACDKEFDRLETVIAKAKAAIAIETYENSVNGIPFYDSCYTTSISASVKSGGTKIDGKYMLATDDLTQSLTGYPLYLDLEVSMGCKGMIEQSTTCTDSTTGNNTTITYKVIQNGASGGFDPGYFVFNSSGGAVAFDQTTMRVTATSATNQAATFKGFDADGYNGYFDDYYSCNGVTTWTVDTIDTAPVESQLLQFASQKTTNAFLVTKRFKDGLFDAVNRYPATVMFFDKEAMIPDNEYYIAYQLEGSETWLYKTPDHIEVVYEDLVTVPDPLNRIRKSGSVDIEAFMDSHDGDKISVASAKIIYQVLKPVVHFTDYANESVTRESGSIPFDKPLEFELELSNLVDTAPDILQVEWDFAGTVSSGDFSKTIRITDPELISSVFPVSYKVYYEDSSGNKIIVNEGVYQDLRVTSQVDRITAKLQDSEIGVTGFQNRFFWEGDWISDNWVTLFGKNDNYEFPLAAPTRDAAQVLYEQRYIARGINKFTPIDNFSSTYTFTPDLDMQNSGGSIGLYQRRIITSDDLETVYREAGFDATPMRYNRRMIVGFNFNLLKLRIHEQAFNRTIVVHVNGPANMEGYSARWTFADDSTVSSPFAKVDGVFQSSTPHLVNLKTVDVLDPGGQVIATVDYVVYWNKNPYGPRELRSLYTANLRQSVTTQHIFDNGAYRTYTKHVETGGDSEELMTFEVELTPGATNPRILRVNNWYPTQIGTIDANQNGVSFYLGNNLLREFELITPPQHGAVTSGYHQVTYTPEQNFTGEDRFSIQLGGDYGPPSEQSTIDYSIDSRILEVVVDMGEVHPTVTLIETATGGEIYRGFLMYKKFIMQFDDAMSVSQQTSIANMELSTSDKDNDTVTYVDNVGGFTETDQGELNGDVQLSFTSHNKSYTETKKKVLASAEEIFISRDFLLSRFEEMNIKPVKSLITSYLPYYSYTQGTDEHLDHVTLYHDGVEVHQDDEFLLNSFKGFTGAAHRTLSGDNDSLYLKVVFEDGDESDDVHKIWFKTLGINPDAPIFFIEKNYSRTGARSGTLTYTPNRRGTVYHVVSSSILDTNQQIRDIADGTWYDNNAINRGYGGASASPQEFSRLLPDDGNDYYLYLFIEDSDGNETPFYSHKINDLPIVGNLDGNGYVNLSDALLGLRLLAGFESDITSSGDSNGDGVIGLADVIYILNKVATN